MFPDAASLPGLLTVCVSTSWGTEGRYSAVNFGNIGSNFTIKTSDIFNERLESHCAVFKTGSVISPGDDDLNSDPGQSDRADHHDACGQLCCDTLEDKSKMKSLLFVYYLQLDIHIQLNIYINDK